MPKVRISNLFCALIASAFIFTNELSAQNINDWENPEVNGVNKEEPHSYSFLSGDKANNPMIKSLNGLWMFKWSPDPQSRPVDFYMADYTA